MIIARSNARFSTYYKSSDSFICLFNICDKNPFHPFMWLLSASSPRLMTDLLNQVSQKMISQKNILHAITWMLLSMTGGEWRLVAWQCSLVAATGPPVGQAQWAHSHLDMHLLLKCPLCSRAFSLSVAFSGVTL